MPALSALVAGLLNDKPLSSQAKETSKEAEAEAGKQATDASEPTRRLVRTRRKVSYEELTIRQGFIFYSCMFGSSGILNLPSSVLISKIPGISAANIVVLLGAPVNVSTSHAQPR